MRLAGRHEDTDRQDHGPLADIAAERGLPVGFLRKHIHVETEGDRAGWVAIPYRHLSGVWLTRYRNPDREGKPKYWQPGGTDTHLYNPLHLGPNASEVWFAEGEFDCLTLAHLNVPAVGIAGTNAFRADWVPLFAEARVVLAFDGDQAGQEAAARAAVAFGRGTRVFPVADGDDISDWWVRDPGGLRKAIEEFRRDP